MTRAADSPSRTANTAVASMGPTIVWGSVQVVRWSRRSILVMTMADATTSPRSRRIRLPKPWRVGMSNPTPRTSRT